MLRALDANQFHGEQTLIHDVDPHDAYDVRHGALRDEVHGIELRDDHEHLYNGVRHELHSEKQVDQHGDGQDLHALELAHECMDDEPLRDDGLLREDGVPRDDGFPRGDDPHSVLLHDEGVLARGEALHSDMLLHGEPPHDVVLGNVEFREHLHSRLQEDADQFHVEEKHMGYNVNQFHLNHDNNQVKQLYHLSIKSHASMAEGHGNHGHNHKKVSRILLNVHKDQKRHMMDRDDAMMVSPSLESKLVTNGRPLQYRH